MERAASRSGLVGSNAVMEMYRPIQMGNWMTIGPRQPIGLTPASLYSRIVSWEMRVRSLAYRFCRA